MKNIKHINGLNKISSHHSAKKMDPQGYVYTQRIFMELGEFLEYQAKLNLPELKFENHTVCFLNLFQTRSLGLPTLNENTYIKTTD